MKRHTLTFKFSIMFTCFTIIALVVSSILSYLNQMHIYKSQREDSIQYVASYLEDVLKADGMDFLWYQKYFLAHYEELLIPHDFAEKEALESRKKYEVLFAQKYPGKVLGVDIFFDDMDEDVKIAYTIFKHEYYLLEFEKARQQFNLIYLEYIRPAETPFHMTYILDSIREEHIVDGKKYLVLGITVENLLEGHEKEWEAWETGKRPLSYDTYDNQYGKTYAFYSPLFINGEKLGLIGAEVEIAKVNKAILQATIQQMFMIGSVLVIIMFLMLFFIRTNYISKLIKLQTVIDEYSLKKDVKIAKRLENEVTNKDEISSIMRKFSELIYELELYMTNLMKTQRDLQDTQKKALELNELAVKDSLTGIRNKTAYDKEVQGIEWEMANGLKDFGVAMIDLNFLKRINDTYGHDKGNIAIISLCQLVCEIFQHSPVFRIGGDEFVVILKKNDLKNVNTLLEDFKQRLKDRQEQHNLEYWEKTSAAIGVAIYNPSTDLSYDNVFKRADAEMYKNKKAMKAVRE